MKLAQGFQLFKAMEELFKMLFNRYFRIPSFEAVVVSVDKEKDTIVCKPEDSPEIPGVKLKSILSDQESKLVIYPAVGSFVTITRLHNLPLDFFVSQYSQVEEIVTNCDKVVYNGGTNGGLVNWPEAKAELDKTKEVVEAIKTALTNWVVVGGDGGGALKVAFTAAIAGKTVGNYDDKEDLKVKH
jgi:hypothetical protein